MKIIWIVSFVLFAYPFAVYPVLVALMARMSRKKIFREWTDAECPAVALVICALNEEKIIGEKIENSLSLRYPEGRLTVMVISDGSTDRTAEIARRYVNRGVVLVERAERRGKIANLNQVLPSIEQEIVVLSDANVLYHSEAVRRLVNRFTDPEVGCVSGKVILTDSAPQLDAPTQQYYSMEWALQENSSAVYSMVGADGAMYALRRSLFEPCPKDTLIEDLIIPMGVIRQGKRVVFESSAIGWERGVESTREEFNRKVRIAAGAAQVLTRPAAWPGNAPARFWFIFLSHKVLRWLSPAFGSIFLLAAIAGVQEPAAQVALAGTLLLTGLALIRMATGSTHTLFTAPFYFLFGQVALGVGLVRGFRGRQTVLWAKANR